MPCVLNTIITINKTTAGSADASSSLRKLRDFHRRVEQETALPYAFKENEKHGWLEGPDAKAIVRKAEKHGHVDEVDLVREAPSAHYVPVR